MNLAKSQPISYKDFIKKVEQASNKQNKLSKNLLNNKSQKKIAQNKNIVSNINCKTPHTQSTSIWDKPSTSRGKAQKKASGIISHNQSITNTDNSVGKSQKKKDQTICYYAFVKQATNILSEIMKISSPQLLSHKISYIQFLQTLKSLKMIRQNYQPYPQDLVSEMWSEYITGQSVGNFILVLCSVLGMSFEGQSTEADDYVKKKYQSLLYTRMELNGTSNNMKHKVQYTFRPQISDRSRKLATSCSKSKSKNKHAKCLNTDRANTSIGHYDGFSSMEDYDDNNLNIRTEHASISSRNNPNGNKRSQMLYELAKEKVQEKRDKDRNLIQYQRNKQQLTFKPHITKSKSKQKIKCKVKGEKITINRMIKARVQRQIKKIISAKGLPYNELTVEKLRKQKYDEILREININFQVNASDQQILLSNRDAPHQQQPQFYHPKQKSPQLKNNWLQRENISQKQQQKRMNCLNKAQNVSYQMKPFLPQQDLVIDVYLSQEHKQKLVIKKGESLEEVAAAFVKQHNLSQSKVEQLIDLLKNSIKNALSPIDQLVEEQDMEMLSARTYKPKGF